MKSQPKLTQILTPPPVSPGNLIASTSMKSVVQNALTVRATRSNPMASPRTVPQRTVLATVHASLPLVAYVVTPDALDKKSGFPTNVVVHHLRTRQVVWTASVGELAASLFDFDVLSRNAVVRQNKAVKDLGNVRSLRFSDPSTLYWNGFLDASTPNNGSRQPRHVRRWRHLFVQFTNRILVVNLSTSPSHLSAARSPAQTGQNQQILAHIAQEHVGALVSSDVLPVAPHQILLGTVDGHLKLYDWNKNKTYKTLKLLAKNDYVCSVCAATPYPNPHGTAASASTASPSSPKRIVALTKKGFAYVIEMQIDTATGQVNELLPPKARFEGGAVPVSVYKADDDHSSQEHIFCRYDGFRDVFMWNYPSKTKARLLVWDLANLPSPDARQRRRGEPAKPDPLLVTQFPYETSHTIFPGWIHENTPMDSLMCAAATKEGDFQMFMAPLYNSASSVKNPFAAYMVQSINLNQILERDVPSDGEVSTHIRVQSISCPSLRAPSTFLVGTNVGILVLQMKDGNLVPFPGSRCAHLSANLGSMGKAVITARNSEIIYGTLDSAYEANAVNPVGRMIPKNPLVVYESPPPLHLPPEIHKRPVRLPPSFLSSPSRNYICCFWKDEMRYEILHVQTLLKKVSSRTDSLMGASPVVASGTGVSSVAWIGDNDVFALLYNPEQDLALKIGIDLSAPTQSLGKELASAASKITDIGKLRDLSKLKELAKMKAVKSSVVGTASKLKSLEGLRDIANTASKATVGTVRGTVKNATKVTVGTAKLTSKVAVGTVKGTMKGTTKVAAGATKVTVGTARASKNAIGGAATLASFGLLGKRRMQAQHQAQESLAQSTTEDEDDQTARASVLSSQSMTLGKSDIGDMAGIISDQERKHPWVELRALVGTTNGPSELDRGSSAATVSNLGELSLRSGNRNPPTVLFGGPVLCVASKVDEDDEGLAYFYTCKRGQDNDRADSYTSSGPAFPCPEIIAWDDDGRLCAVAIQSQVMVYLSEEPEFVFLGTARLGSPTDSDLEIVSVSFVHGTLFCATRTAVHCVFLGDLRGGICNLDSYKLASTDVAAIPVAVASEEYAGLTPTVLPMPLAFPSILGYQNGSLMVSVVSGIQAVPLSHPILRIGSLLAAGQHQRAERWFEAVPSSDHETLAYFLERRGVPELALSLSGLSLETTVDICMKYGFVDRLEETVELYGLEGIRLIDMGQGLSSNAFGREEDGVSLVVSVGAYLLSYGRIELVRRLASECLTAGVDGRKDGFMLAGLLLSAADGSDSRRVIKRAVQGESKDGDGWLVGKCVRDRLLAGSGR